MRRVCRAIYIGAAVMAGSVCAQVYYVAPDGNDASVGSQAAPFLTVQHAYGVALSSAAPALITLAPGTYCASNPLVLAGAQVLLQGAGVEQSVIADAVVVTGDTRLADLTCAGAFSNAASACLVHNVKLSVPPSGAGCLYGLWYDADDYAQLSSLAEPRDGFDAVNALWVSNHVRQAALLRSGGAMSGALYLDGAINASSQAATKAYVDSSSASVLSSSYAALSVSTNIIAGTYVSKAGDSMHGALHIAFTSNQSCTAPGAPSAGGGTKLVAGAYDDWEWYSTYEVNVWAFRYVDGVRIYSSTPRLLQQEIMYGEDVFFNFGWHWTAVAGADGYLVWPCQANGNAMVVTGTNAVDDGTWTLALPDNRPSSHIMPLPALATDGTIDARSNRVMNVGTPQQAADAATKAYVDQSLLYNYDAIIGHNFASVKAAIDSGATNIFIPPGSFYEEWTSPVYVSRPLRIQGSGKAATKLGVRTRNFSQSGGIIINMLNNGYFEVCDLSLTVTNDCGNSLRGFFEINSPCLLRLTSLAGSLYAPNNELWFIKTQDGVLSSVAVVCDDIDYLIRTASRAGFMVLQQTRPTLYFRNSRLVIDKMGSGSGTDGVGICCGLKDARDGIIYCDNVTYMVSNHTADAEYLLALVNDGNGGLKSVFMNNCHVQLNKANGRSCALWLRADVEHVNLSGNYIEAATGVWVHVNAGGGYGVSNMVVYGNTFNTRAALDFGSYARPQTAVAVGNCIVKGVLTNSGCMTPVTVNDIAAYSYIGSNAVSERVYLNASGDNVGGPLYLSGAITDSSQAVTKAYVDAISLTPGPAGPTGPTGAQGPTGPAGVANLSEVSNQFVLITGGAMTGFLRLPSDPQSNEHAATKHYVDNCFKGFDYDTRYVYIDKYYDGTNGYQGTLQAPYTNFLHALARLGSNSFYGYSQPVVYHLGHGFYSYPSYTDPGNPYIYLRIGIVGRGAFYKNIHEQLSGNASVFSEFGTYVDDIRHAWPSGYNTNNAILYLKDMVVSGAYLFSSAHDEIYCDNVVFLSVTNNGQQTYHGVYYSGALVSTNMSDGHYAALDANSIRPGYWTAAQASNDASYVRRAGDTMTGSLTVGALLTASNINVSVPDWHVGSESSVGNVIVENASGKIRARRGHLYLKSDSDTIVAESPLAFSSGAGVRGTGATTGQSVSCSACSSGAQVIITPTSMPPARYYVHKDSGYFIVYTSTQDTFTFDWLVIPAGP